MRKLRCGEVGQPFLGFTTSNLRSRDGIRSRPTLTQQHALPGGVLLSDGPRVAKLSTLLLRELEGVPPPLRAPVREVDPGGQLPQPCVDLTGVCLFELLILHGGWQRPFPGL